MNNRSFSNTEFWLYDVLFKSNEIWLTHDHTGSTFHPIIGFIQGLYEILSIVHDYHS
jgi:hypothetical protein